jgi:hypothetical protein
MHLAGLSDHPANETNPSRWTATVLITVRDNGGDLVAGAEVTGTWTPAVGSSSPVCTTEATGQCTVSQSGMQRSGTNTVFEAIFTLGAISHPELDYAPTDNQGPLQITIQKP